MDTSLHELGVDALEELLPPTDHYPINILLYQEDKQRLGWLAGILQSGEPQAGSETTAFRFMLVAIKLASLIGFN
ncbi:hypothetical protein IQ268_18225 [Oculatella sp. LEGE 06141]|uniref:hypothetical protein n=1 Tax=Oculatella sp. LEGE 06141 TaxID=1828648 RepID=UPI00187E16E2|nr:hypothetical protein [Oculatella sp. LEGE 06141]MBE9180502.1 hypothetical protein [Oculatella sp. LEGE 06141]